MKLATLNIEVRLDDRAERISSLEQAVSFVQRLVDEVGGFVANRKRALQIERDARLRLGHALLQIQPALSKAGVFHEFVAGLRMNQRTVQEMLRVTRQFSTGGVFDLHKVEAAIARVRTLLESTGGDAAIRAVLARPIPAALNTQHLRVLATWDAKAVAALAGTTKPGPSDDAHARAPAVRENPNASCAVNRSRPTHEAPTVAGLQVDQGDKVVWSAQLGRWMVEVGEVLYEVHEFADMREGARVEWPGGVTPAGYDHDSDGEGEDFDDDENESYDGDEDGDWDDDDAAFADDDDEPLEDDEDDFEDKVADAPGRGASGPQLMLAGLFEAASSTARTISGLADKLQHEALISPRELDEAQHAADTFIAAIADARRRLVREDQP